MALICLKALQCQMAMHPGIGVGIHSIVFRSGHMSKLCYEGFTSVVASYDLDHLLRRWSALETFVTSFADLRFQEEAPGQVVRIASIRWAGPLNTVTGPAGCVACSGSGAAVRWR